MAFLVGFALNQYWQHELLRYKIEQKLGKEITDVIIPYEVDNLMPQNFTINEEELYLSKIHSGHGVNLLKNPRKITPPYPNLNLPKFPKIFSSE
jgi:hypothetical protein